MRCSADTTTTVSWPFEGWPSWESGCRVHWLRWFLCAPGAVKATAQGSPPPPEFGGPVLVVSNYGVCQISPDGTATLLVDGAVAYAVDDTQGGLVFQLERGRAGGVAPGDRSTVIWWVPQGASAPQELLVPTPGSGHRLTLHDVYATGDGFAILYTRHEGSIPDVDMIDTLRRVEVPDSIVTVLCSQGAFE